MARLFCSSDLVKCVLSYNHFCHRLFSFQKPHQTHIKCFSNSIRRYANNVMVISTLRHTFPKNLKLLVNDSFRCNSNSLNHCVFQRFSSHRYLSSKSSNTSDDTNNDKNKHTELNNETKDTKMAVKDGNASTIQSNDKKENDVKKGDGVGGEGTSNGSKVTLDDISKIGFETSVTSSKTEEESDLKEKEIVMKVDMEGWRRMKTDFSKIYTDNIFVPLSRAMPEYLLENSELEKLPKYTRRSPYPRRDNITVFKKKHLEKRAIDKWGSLENLQLQKDFLRARQEKLKKQTFSMRQELYSYLDDQESPYSIEQPYLYQPKEEIKKTQQDSPFYQASSARVVMFAVACNSLNCLMKLVAWLYTGSHSMFAEVIHSAADTINQVILAIGIKQSMKEADSSHPYGWAKFRNVSSLISGVGIFCVGSGLSFYHGVTGLLYPTEPTSMYWALATLGASFVFEGGTLLVAMKELHKGTKKANIPIKEYLTRGIDPTTTVVLMEDAAAVVGILIASTAISITQWTGSGIPDAIGSLLIGTLLGGVASFIIYTNTTALVGRSIPADKRLALVTELESDRMIRTLIDVKATEAGGRFIRFKAEVDFDGREVTRSYLETLDMEKFYQEMKVVNSVEEAECFMLKHGECVIDALGSAVDRIETNLKKKHPEIRHCDLEQL